MVGQNPSTSPESIFYAKQLEDLLLQSFISKVTKDVCQSAGKFKDFFFLNNYILYICYESILLHANNFTKNNNVHSKLTSREGVRLPHQ